MTVRAWLLAAAAIAMTVTGAALATAEPGAVSHSAVFFVLVLAVVFATAVVGALVASRRPANPIGWIFLGFSTFRAFSALAAGYAEVAPDGASHGLGQYAAWLFNWSYVSLFAFSVFVLLLFPNGRLLPGRRWRVAFRCAIVGTAGLVLSGATQPGPLDDFPGVQNPLGTSGALSALFLLVGAIAMLTALAAAVASVVVRYRAGAELERQQIKWLGLAGLVTVTGLLGGLAIALAGPQTLGYSITLGGLVAIPIGIGIAMLRYRLYDVDRIISRSLTYGLVTIALGAAYAGLVLGGQALFSAFAGGSNLAIAVSTLVVAALFLPVRARVQGFVDRRFYRSRYDTRRTLDAFGSRLREHVELERLRAELQDVVRETMQPAHVSLWLRRESS